MPRVRVYRRADGGAPFVEWFEALRDLRAVSRIEVRVRRAGLGDFGDHRFLGGGLLELRVDSGPGYRVYVGVGGAGLVLLLCGGDKSTQEMDISRAREFWDDHRRRQ
ncbi:MAG: type II toxin-antitoxin system RelE/ParE family toxin [Elusimicrobia bacterium]|nr:type II toxin-antitoxin system RelE/ParE family toxin [Elusimicrobiota bacterium]